MRNTAQDIIAITQAALDGKPVEVLIGDKAWTLIASLRFDWDKYVYRVRPKKEELHLGAWKFHEQPNYGMAVYRDGSFVANMTWEVMDAFHAASLKARGIENPQYKEPEVSQDYSAGYLAGYKVGKSDQLEATGGK